MTGAVPSPWPEKHAARALLGYVMDIRLAGAAAGPAAVSVPSPWDAWWACYRARSVHQPGPRHPRPGQLPSLCPPGAASRCR